jgi:hypothetical protein
VAGSKRHKHHLALPAVCPTMGHLARTARLGSVALIRQGHASGNCDSCSEMLTRWLPLRRRAEVDRFDPATRRSRSRSARGTYIA